MSEKRRVSASVDAEMIEAGHQAVAAGFAETMSAWVNAALHRQSEHDARLRAADRFLAGRVPITSRDDDQILTSDPHDILVLARARGLFIEIERV